MIERHEEETFTAGGVRWDVGGGVLTSPGVFASMTPAVLSGEASEATVQWDVTASLNTAARVNDAIFVARNNATNGKKTKLDRVTLVVTYTTP